MESCKNTQKESIIAEKEPYEPCKMEILEVDDDVIRTSSAFTTSGFYDEQDGWDFFNEGIV